MSIQKIISSFTTSCWTSSVKTLVLFLKTLDKKLPNFQLFLNAKKYNSTNKVNFSDKERYDVFVTELVKLVQTEDSLKSFCINFDNWILELESCLKQEQIYNLLSTNFLKGSYSKMIDDFNRILVPKNKDEDDDDNIDPMDNLKKCVKNYSQDFENVLEECVNNGFLLYKSEHGTIDEDVLPICEQMLNQENPVFSIYSIDNSDKIFALWVSDKSLEFQSVDYNEYIAHLTNVSYTFCLNPEHQTNMDTLKRNYINKQTDLFRSHVKMLSRSGSLYFYKGNYLHSKDYDNYSELQFSNLVNSFPVNFEDYAKNTFALFYFTKGENVTVDTFWITSKPVEQILSVYDHALFDWIDSNCDKFLSASVNHTENNFSMLH